MSETTIHRTLVKSPPELWAELSDAATLARHLGEFGEIRITRTEPETTVAWEGERASGTVTIEPSGWGTRVMLSAAPVAPRGAGVPREPEEAEPSAQEEVPGQQQETVPAPGPQEPPRRGLLERLRFWHRRRKVRSTDQREADAQRRDARRVAAGQAPAAVRAGADEPSELAIAARGLTPGPSLTEDEGSLTGDEAEAVLGRLLDTLSQAHHRPFSRD